MITKFATPDPIDIVVVDDDTSVLTALARQIRAMGYSVASFGDPQDALIEIRNGVGKCLLVDLGMPGMNGLELQSEVTALGRPLPIVFISGEGTVRASVEAMLQGAVDFLEKPLEMQDLKSALKKALATWESEAQEDSKRVEAERRFSTLTARQKDVFRMMITGVSNKEISRHLNISERTVKAHRQAIMERIAARNIADVFHLAEALGLSREA